MVHPSFWSFLFLEMKKSQRPNLFSLLVEKSPLPHHSCPASPSLQETTYKEQFWPPNVEIISFHLGNYLIINHQKLRHVMEASQLIYSTADGGESGTLKNNVTYKL